MEESVSIKTALKRGALVAAANWQVTAIQFVAESTFKVLLSIPVVGGALLVALVLGHDLPELVGGGFRGTVTFVAATLLAEPMALVAFLVAFSFVGFAGSVLMFLVKGGSVAVMAEAERLAGRLEHPPLRMAAFWHAARFSIEAFQAGCMLVFRRYLRLGLLLIAVYVGSAAGYLGLLYGAYVTVGHHGFGIGWTMVAGLLSTALVLWVTLVNFVYLLIQIGIVIENQSVRMSTRHVVRFLRSEPRLTFGVFGVVLALVLTATVVSFIATTSLGLIAFVPFVGLAVVPLQLLAWMFRGIVFEFLGTSALGAYVFLYRRYASREVAAAESREPDRLSSWRRVGPA